MPQSYPPKQLEIGPGPEQQNPQEEIKIKRHYPDLGPFGNPFTMDQVTKEMDKREALRRLSTKPKVLQDLRVVKELVMIGGRDMLRMNIWFFQQSDPNFNGARVWIKGYETGNVLGDDGQDTARQDTLPFVLKAVINRSPYTTLFEKTLEEIVIGVEAINADGIGSGLDTMPTQAITLEP